MLFMVLGGFGMLTAVLRKSGAVLVFEWWYRKGHSYNLIEEWRK